jgi:cytoskeletal protein RodZ
MSKNITSAIIVAVAILVISLIVAGIYSASKNKGEGATATTTTADSSASVTTQANSKKSGNDATANTSNSNNSSATGFITIDSDTLPEPSCTSTVGVVQGKTVRLENNELFYSLDLLVGSENLQLSYIVGLSGYDAVNVGDKLTVQLAAYTTDNGSVFYLVQGVQTLD